MTDQEAPDGTVCSDARGAGAPKHVYHSAGSTILWHEIVRAISGHGRCTPQEAAAWADALVAEAEKRSRV